jgi:hypothetical protein
MEMARCFVFWIRLLRARSGFIEFESSKPLRKFTKARGDAVMASSFCLFWKAFGSFVLNTAQLKN